MGKTNLTLKLLIDRNVNRVPYAEANKEMVKFLFTFFFPCASMISDVTESKISGCIKNLCNSVEKLDETYFLQNNKNENICPFCGHKSTTEKLSMVSHLAEVGSSNEGGYVKEATYIVTDNLNVIPLSTLSIINLLDERHVDAKALEEKVIDLDDVKGLGEDLLVTSLQSQETLSEVFLKPDVTSVKEVVLPVKEENAKPADDISLVSNECESTTPDTKRKASVDFNDPTNEGLYKELQDSITKNDKHSFVKVIEKTQRKSKRNCGSPKRLDL